MVKLHLSFCIIAFFFGSLCAQNVSVSVSNLEKSNRGSQISTAGKIGDYIYLVRREDAIGREMNLQIYKSSNMELVSTRNVKNVSCRNNKNCIDKQFDYERTLFFNDKMIMFFRTYNSKKKEHQLFAQIVDDRGDFQGKLTLVDKIHAEKRRKAGSFNIRMCEDSTKFLILQHPVQGDKDDDEEYKFKIYDNRLNNLHNLSHKIAIKDKNITVSDYILGNNSKIFLLCNVRVDKKKREKGEALGYNIIYTLDPKTNALSEYKLQLPEKDIESVAIKINNEKELLYCTGLYSEIAGNKHTGKDIDGFFFLKINQNNSDIVSKSFKRLDKDLVRQVNDVSKKSKKKKSKTNSKNKNEGISKNFSIRHVKDKVDGSIHVITELRYYYVTSTTTCDSNGHCRTTYTYHYVRNNILTMNISPEGEITSFVDIPKYQHTVNDNGYFSSFGYLEKGDNVVFVYNDNPENLSSAVKSMKEVKSMGNIKKTCLVAASIKSDGKYTKTKIYDNFENLIVSAPEDAIEINEGIYVAPVYKMTKGCGCFKIFAKPSTGLMKYELK